MHGHIDGEPLTLGIVDNDPLVASALARSMRLSGAPVRVLWTAHSADEAVEACLDGTGGRRPRALLTDLEMPHGGGYELAQALQPRLPGIPIVGMTAFELTRPMEELRSAGIVTVLDKAAPMEEFLETLARAADDEALRAWVRGERAAALPSDQELDVLRRYADGQTTQAIARGMHVGETTVKTYARRAFAKLGVSSRAEAIVACMRRGLL